MPLEAPTVWMPTDPPRQAPYVMTAEDVICLLRIDDLKVKNKRECLDGIRDRFNLQGIRIGKEIRFTLPEVLRAVNDQLERRPQ